MLVYPSVFFCYAISYFFGMFPLFCFLDDPPTTTLGIMASVVVAAVQCVIFKIKHSLK